MTYLNFPWTREWLVLLLASGMLSAGCGSILERDVDNETGSIAGIGTDTSRPDTADTSTLGPDARDTEPSCSPAVISANSAANAVLPTDCKGLNDFTPCSVITTPDRRV
ncbi:MAG: hypothetical protein JXR76_03790 [Deltaproteobacteria bacterium]|nr:hypothetical protein [Deltaproteobacteria bacterium]